VVDVSKRLEEMRKEYSKVKEELDRECLMRQQELNKHFAVLTFRHKTVDKLLDSILERLGSK
jgi:hypothetical protein